MKKIFLINHIPKCAGSSLRKSLENNFKDELLNLSYNPIRSGKYEYIKLIYTKLMIFVNSDVCLLSYIYMYDTCLMSVCLYLM